MSRTASSRRRLTAVVAATSLALALGGAAVSTAQAAEPDEAGPLMNYLVNSRTDRMDLAAAAIQAAGGTVVVAYPEIGVTVAQSTNNDFRYDVRHNDYAAGVQSVGATRTAAVKEGPAGLQSTDSADSADAAAVSPEPLEGQQYGLKQIKADLAHDINQGSRSVVVGIVDSGVEATHPDLAPNLDAADSVGCTNNGIPDTSPAAWAPTTSDHGTHVAGIVAAARNGIGVAGVAPNVRIASVKVVNDDGFIYPEYSICGIMWATSHNMPVTNHSYFIDPWEFWCNDGGDQGAVQEAVRRAYKYSNEQGTLSIAAAGNSNKDLAHKTSDANSPNDTTPALRTINNGCLDMPTELPNVVTVASTTSTKAKSSFSNFGIGVIDVAAPGSSVLSTILNGRYGLKSGTSMASPHVTGVAALIKSTHPEFNPRQIAQALRSDADDNACPATPDPRCTGSTSYNSFFGEGIVDALDAVTK